MGVHENTVVGYEFILIQEKMKIFIINYYLIGKNINAIKWYNILNNYAPDVF